MDKEKIKENLDELLGNQIKSINKLKNSEQFEKEIYNVYKLLKNYKKKIIFMGIGKSGYIAKKAAASFSSTGSMGIFLNPVEALHGDLGIVSPNEIVILISHSGNTKEILNVIPSLKKFNLKIISITSNKNSKIAQNSNYHINTLVEKENCPHNLAPTISTTTTLVILDIVMVLLMKGRKFQKKEFAKFHPAGNLGERILLKLKDLVNNNNHILNSQSNFIEIISQISKSRKGIAPVIENNKIIGVVTDGDLRRGIEKYKKEIYSIKCEKIMTTNPIIISNETLAIDTLKIMETNEISAILIIDKNNKYVGCVNIYDILNLGIKK